MVSDNLKELLLDGQLLREFITPFKELVDSARDRLDTVTNSRDEDMLLKGEIQGLLRVMDRIEELRNELRQNKQGEQNK